jgi:hypothetical protein
VRRSPLFLRHSDFGIRHFFLTGGVALRFPPQSKVQSFFGSLSGSWIFLN